MLTPQIQAEILSMFFGQKKKVRAIARKLKIDRKTVTRIVGRDSVQVQVRPNRRVSIIEPFREKILGLLAEDPETTNVVILQRIRDQGFMGGKTTLRDWLVIHRPKPSRREAYFKLEFEPGDVAQVDWGELGTLLGDGVKIHCFVMVLCYSRLLYVEVTRSEKFEDFIRCHENAFKYFGGFAPQTCWYDNLASAVTERMGGLVRFNSRFLAFLGHHHIRPHACNPARGNEKGRVEDGVKYVKMNFLHSRKFKDFADLSQQMVTWRDQIANFREHRATRKIPKLLFEHEELPKLHPISPVPYDTDEVFSEKVRPDYHVTYDTNEYSVPWTLVGQVITARITPNEIQFYYREKFVTKHERSYLKHQKPFTQPEHKAGLVDTKPQGKAAHVHWQIQVLESYGPELVEYLQYLRQSQRSIRQEVARLIALGTVYGEGQLASIVRSLLKRGSIGADQIELALQQATVDQPKRPAPIRLNDERLERIPPKIDLRKYDRLIFTSSEGSSESNSPSSSTTDSQENLSHD